MPFKLFLLIALIIMCNDIRAYNNFEVGAKSAAMGQSSVMIPDIWSAHHNQGGMAFYNKLALGVHHENRFLVPQYAYQSAILTVPVKPGVFGLNYSYFGYKLYNDKKIGIGYSMKILDNLAVGIQADVISTYISAYGSEHRICPEIGILSEPIKHLYVGVHVFNPFKTNYKDLVTYNIPSVYRIGAGYTFDEKLMITTEAEKDTENAPVFKGGIDFNALYGLQVRVGIHTNPSQYSFGLGYIFNSIMADISFVSHPDLGFTPHFSICYEFKL